jgi:hypothetical protein
MTEPEFELNEEGKVSRITITSSGSDWDKALKSMNEGMKKWVDEEIDKIKYNNIKNIINGELNEKL